MTPDRRPRRHCVLLTAASGLGVACLPGTPVDGAVPVRPCPEDVALSTDLSVGHTAVGTRQAWGADPEDPDLLVEVDTDGVEIRRRERTRDDAGHPVRELEDLDGDGLVDREHWWRWEGDALAWEAEAARTGSVWATRTWEVTTTGDTTVEVEEHVGELESLRVERTHHDPDGDGRWNRATARVLRARGRDETTAEAEAERRVSPLEAGEDDTWRWLPAAPLEAWPDAAHLRTQRDAGGRPHTQVLRLAMADEEISAERIHGWDRRIWDGAVLLQRTTVRLAPAGGSPFARLDDLFLAAPDPQDPGRVLVQEERRDAAGRRLEEALGVGWLEGEDPARQLAQGHPATETRLTRSWTRDEAGVPATFEERTMLDPGAWVRRVEEARWTCEPVDTRPRRTLEPTWGPPS